MMNGPGYLRLESRLRATTLAEAAAIVAPSLAREEVSEASIDGKPARPGWPKVIPRGARRAALTSGERGNGRLHPAYGREDAYQFSFGYDARAPGPDAVRGILERLADVARQLADRGALEHVAIYRHDGGIFSPIPPLAGVATHLVSATAEQVAAAYGDPAAFAAAWDAVEERGAMTLYLRAMNAVANPAFLEHVLPGQMAMARAARPGLVRWAAPELAPGELELLEEGGATLSGVGYSEAERTYEFAGYLPEESELRAVDLMLAARVASEKWVEAADGRRLPVDVVRAVFDNRDSAERADVLLRTIGVQTLYMDDAGELVTL